MVVLPPTNFGSLQIPSTTTFALIVSVLLVLIFTEGKQSTTRSRCCHASGGQILFGDPTTDDLTVDSRRECLQQSNYCERHPTNHGAAYTRSCLHLARVPLPPRTVRDESYQLLVLLFLLGLANAATRVQSNNLSVSTSGIVGRCEVDSILWIRLVSILPRDIEDGTTKGSLGPTLMMTNNWFLDVLNEIHMTKNDHQPVMYIGLVSLCTGNVN